MAHLGKCLPDKYEDLSPDRQHPHAKTEAAAHSVILVLTGKDPWGLSVASGASELQSQGETLTQKAVSTGFCMNAHMWTPTCTWTCVLGTFMCTHTHRHTCIHTHTHRRQEKEKMDNDWNILCKCGVHLRGWRDGSNLLESTGCFCGERSLVPRTIMGVVGVLIVSL